MRSRKASFAYVGLSLLFTVSIGNPAGAEKQGLAAVKGVVELFTSQGCSSCPPADKLFKTYVDRPDVIALTLPVDYWDYLGWKDTFSNPRNSQRQRDYATRRGDGAVYTPQVVVNGRMHVVGTSKRDIDAAIETLSRQQPLAVPVSMVSDGGTLVIKIGASEDGTSIRDATVWLAVVQKKGEVEVGRGENTGRKLAYHNVVREMSPVGIWNGLADEIRLSRKSVMWRQTDRCVVLVQHGTGGPILGAAEWARPASGTARSDATEGKKAR